MNTLMQELSPEDALRLNVLLANELHAVRLDESSMAVHGLTPQGETVIRLNPTCRDEQYVKIVRELLSGQVLGSPGGYPVFLKRWTRMGQARDENLEKLLLLGEPEAVIAVVHAPGITHEIARRAWWIMPSADNARKMLARECVAGGPLGRELAAFLVEFLPFEESHQAIIDSVRLVLQPGLISEPTREQLWKKARNKNTYYVGFLQTLPDALPEPATAHPQLASYRSQLEQLAASGNEVAGLVLRVLDEAGQSFLTTTARVLKKPNNQSVVVELFESLKAYFAAIQLPGERLRAVELLEEEAAQRLAGERSDDPCAGAIQEILIPLPELAPMLEALCFLSAVGERLVAPVFATTDAIGSVMRRKIEPIVMPVTARLQTLQSGPP